MTLLYSFYGDDFTGSTDVLEQLYLGGVEAVLFLRLPDENLLSKFSDAQAIGLAGDARSRPPDWMREHLPGIYRALSASPIFHYKTCSTFDSAPDVGSIGKALDVGLAEFGGPAAIMIGAPHLRRYLIGGHLFAAAGSEIYRIDRHPTMSRHPVTPMSEADMRLHLSAQSSTEIGLVSFEQLRDGAAGNEFDRLSKGADAIMFDGISDADLRAAGNILSDRNVPFVVGSSGVTRAMVHAWADQGMIERGESDVAIEEVSQILVVSGSCSPVTAKQIEAAEASGYDLIGIDMALLLKDESSEEERLINLASRALGNGANCVIYSALGPLEESGIAVGDRLGQMLGRVARALTARTALRRVIFAGGDSSSHGVAQLGIDALTCVASIETGAPLVRAHAPDDSIDGLQLVLKGGQMGGDDFFEKVRRGTTV